MGGKEKKEKRKMNPDLKIFLIFFVIFVVGFSILLFNVAKPKVVTVATIDKSAVSSNEFNYFLTQNIANALQYKTDSSMDDTTFLNSSTGSGTVIDTVKQQTLGQVLQMELLLLKANKDGFTVSSSDLANEWNTFKATLQQNADYNKVSLKDFTKNALGVSLGVAEKVYKDYIRSQKYFEAKSAEIAIDETKLAEYYKTNKSTLDHATVRHILVTCAKDADTATTAEKKKLAEDILAKVKNGDDFSALAKEYSEDPGSKDNGGVYNIQPNGQMVPQFEDWTFSHAAGDTGIIQTDFGFHVMKLDSISNTLESQRKDVVKAYQDGEYTKTLDDELSGNKYKIDVNQEVYGSLNGN